MPHNKKRFYVMLNLLKTAYIDEENMDIEEVEKEIVTNVLAVLEELGLVGTENYNKIDNATERTNETFFVTQCKNATYGNVLSPVNRSH